MKTISPHLSIEMRTIVIDPNTVVLENVTLADTDDVHDYANAHIVFAEVGGRELHEEEYDLINRDTVDYHLSKQGYH